MREVARHREMLQQKMKARTQARVALEMLASQRPRPTLRPRQCFDLGEFTEKLNGD